MGRMKLFPVFLIGLTVALAAGFSAQAFAGAPVSVSDIAGNAVESSKEMPGLLSGLAYLLGLILAGMGVIKMKEHVENPNQARLREPVAHLFAGGGLFALPAIYEAMKSMFGPESLFEVGALDLDATGQ